MCPGGAVIGRAAVIVTAPVKQRNVEGQVSVVKVSGGGSLV